MIETSNHYSPVRAVAVSIALIFVATEAAAVVAIGSIIGLIVSGISKAILG
jgi:hypothetical protein